MRGEVGMRGKRGWRRIDASFHVHEVYIVLGICPRPAAYLANQKSTLRGAVVHSVAETGGERPTDRCQMRPSPVCPRHLR